MNYKSFNLGDWINHISGVIEDEGKLDGNEMRDLVEFLSGLSNWIPVSERLPIDGQKVLVTTRGDCVYTSRFYHWSAFWEHYVIAWMPLPEPYQPPKMMCEED